MAARQHRTLNVEISVAGGVTAEKAGLMTLVHRQQAVAVAQPEVPQHVVDLPGAVAGPLVVHCVVRIK